MEPIEWGSTKGKPVHMYKIRLVNREIIYMASTETLAEVRSHFLAKYLSQGLVINIEIEGGSV